MPLNSILRIVALVLIVCFATGGPALATRQSAELAASVKELFQGCRIRLDGAIETKSGDLYLALMPSQILKKSKVELIEPPTKARPDYLFFDNGVSFGRVVPGSVSKSCTLSALTTLSEKNRKIVLAAHFPEDLIVPEGFLLPPGFKSVVGQTAIPLAPVQPAVAVAASANSPSDQVKVKRAVKKGGLFITSRTQGNIALIDENTWKKLSDFPTEGTPAGMVNLNGKLYIADQSKNRILILDPYAKQFVGQIDLLPKSAPKSLVALPNEKLLYVSESGTADVAVVEVATSKVLLRTKVAPGPARMAITPNGNTVLVLNSITGQVTFISTLNQRVLGLVNVGPNPTSIVISPDGKTAYVSCRGAANHIAVIEISKRLLMSNIKTGNGPTGLAISADGAVLYNACAKDNLIAVFDCATRSSVKQIKLPLDIDFPGNITLMPDGKKLIVSSATTPAFGVLDVASGEFECQPQIGQSSDEIIWAPIE